MVTIHSKKKTDHGKPGQERSKRETAPAAAGGDGWKAIGGLIWRIEAGVLVRHAPSDWPAPYAPHECTESEGQEIYLGFLDAMGAWCQRLGNVRIASMCADAAGDRDFDCGRGTVGRLVRVWFEKSWPTAPIPDDTAATAPMMKLVIEGIREVVIHEAHAIDNILADCMLGGPDRALSPENAHVLANEMGYPEIAAELTRMRSDSFRRRAFVAHFSLPQYLDQLCAGRGNGDGIVAAQDHRAGCEPDQAHAIKTGSVALRADGRRQATATGERDVQAPALEGSRFRISADYQTVTEITTGRITTGYTAATEVALRYMVANCPNSELRKKGDQILTGASSIHETRYGAPITGYATVGQLFRTDQGRGLNRKKPLIFYGELVKNNGRNSMYWLEV